MAVRRFIRMTIGGLAAAFLASHWAPAAHAQNAAPPGQSRNAAPLAQPQAGTPPAQPPAEFTLVGMPVYKPPLRGAPESRVSGGTRSGNAARAEVFVLAPEATGHSMSTTPTLYWYFLTGARGKVQVTVTQDDLPKPILDVTLDAPASAGIYSLSLADRRVTLQRGVEYQWSVALITDPARRERDVVASARLLCVEPPAGVQQRLAAAAPQQRPAILADASLWYDALTAVADAIAVQPDARSYRAALLEQVGLKDAAAYDRGR